MDRCAASLHLHPRIRLQPFSGRVFCSFFLVPTFARVGALAFADRSHLYLGDLLVVESRNQSWDPSHPIGWSFC